MSEGVASTVLETLLAHDRAEAKLRWLYCENAGAEELAEASRAVELAWVAYCAASAEWFKLATNPPPREVTPDPRCPE